MIKKMLGPVGIVLGAAERVILGPKGDIDDIKTRKPKGNKSYSNRIGEIEEMYGTEAAKAAKDAAEQNLWEAVKKVRRGIRKVMVRLGFITVVGATVTGGCVVCTTSKAPAMRAAEKALDAQLDDISAKFEVWKNGFMQHAEELKKLFGDLIDILKTTEFWKEFGTEMAEGLKKDFLEIVKNGDFHPDKIKKSFEEFLGKNKKFTDTLDKIEDKAKEMKDHLGEFDDDLGLDMEKRKEQFYKDWNKEFSEEWWKEIKKITE
jgi:hypothetical protein